MIEDACANYKTHFLPFYPTALKDYQGIVFSLWCLDGRVGRWAGGRLGRWAECGRREKVCPGCISKTVRCRMLILGKDIG